MASAATLPPAGAQPSPPSPPVPSSPSPDRWTALNTGTAANLTAVSFADPLVGHVVGAAGTILATTDGGKTWQPEAACTDIQPCEPSSRHRLTAELTGVGFWDPTHGVAMGAGGTIISTEDGGKTWTPRVACERSQPCLADSPDRTTADFGAVSVVAPSHIYAVGKAGTMVASDDYGRTWRRLSTCGTDTPVGSACSDGSPKQPADLTAVSATSAKVVHAAGTGGVMLATSSGGRSLHRIGICIEGCSGPVVPVAEQLKDREQGILRTFLPPPITTDLAGVALRDRRRSSSRIYAVGAGGLIVTAASAGAQQWTVQLACRSADLCDQSSSERVREHLRGLAFPNDLAGYAVGDRGTIVSLHRPPSRPEDPVDPDSAAAAGQWGPQESGTTNDLNGVSFPTPDVGYAVGDTGTVVKLNAAVAGVQVDNVRPARGPTVGRTDVKITGRGFTGATDVYFGPIRALGYKVESDTQITATAPPWPAGVVHITVAMPNGPSPAVSAGRYAYVTLVGGAWQPTAPCPPGCAGPGVALSDGKVLVAGGAKDDFRSGSAATAVYDPATRAWTASVPLAQPRTVHTMTTLADGRALVAGGYAGVTLPSRVPDISPRRGAEVYDPRSGTWSAAGDLIESRFHHAATLLADGRVLLTGGFFGTALPGAEIWDPRSAAWSPTASMGTGRLRHTATRLADGSVLVVGGCNPTCKDPLASAEVYEPASGRWRSTAPLKGPHAGHTATVMEDGEVLVVGGIAQGAKAVPFVERYDPKRATWTASAPMHVPRALHSATALADGRLLVTGGVTSDPTRDQRVEDLTTEPVTSAEIYDPDSDRWSLMAEMPVPRAQHAALLLETNCGQDCGKVLVSGGGETLEPPLLYEPAKAESARDGTGIARVLLLAGGLVVALGAIVLVTMARRRCASRGSCGALVQTHNDENK